MKCCDHQYEKLMWNIFSKIYCFVSAKTMRNLGARKVAQTYPNAYRYSLGKLTLCYCHKCFTAKWGCICIQNYYNITVIPSGKNMVTAKHSRSIPVGICSNCKSSRIVHLHWFNADPDPAFFLIADIRIQGLNDKKLKKICSCTTFFYIFWIENCNLLILRPP
jgi:hypothetical protein